jgi:hypothetical protein
VHESKKLVKKNGAEFRMMASESAVYFANPAKDTDGFLITSTPIQNSEVLPPAVAIVRKHHRGKRFSVVDPNLEKPFDDRAPEILGMCYIHLPENKTKCRTFRVAMPMAGAHYPVTEAKELARVAETGEIMEKVIQFVTTVPAIGPDGVPINLFGGMFLVESVKNFVIHDENEVVLFMLYKSAERTFNVKGKAPFTPLTVFALAVAIISG